MRSIGAIAVGVIGAVALAAGCGSSAKSGSATQAIPSTTTRPPSSADSTSTTNPSQNPRVRVSFLLPASIASGKRVNATLVIQTDSGAPVVTNACLNPGESVLGQVGLSTFPPPPPPTTTTLPPDASTSSTLPNPGGPCMGDTHVIAREGTTRVAFLLEASSSLCQLAPAPQLQVHACLPGGTPLRPGTYYIDYDWYGILPTPAITVPVVAATS